MITVPINYLAAGAAAAASWGLGMLWYSPVLFGNQWQKLSKIDPKKTDMKKEMPKIFLISILASFISAVVMAMLLTLTVATTLYEGLVMGFWLWLGFVATTMINGVLYEKKPWALYIITSGYQLAALMVMGAILMLWP